MTKVGILTFHFADNYGAVLQSFALHNAINSICGCHATIIDYVPASFRYEHRWGSGYEKRHFLKKRELFGFFLNSHCSLSDRCNHVDGEQFDVYCVGSDQLWNTSVYYKAYFLGDIPDEKKKVSYATSISLANDSPYLLTDPFKKFIPRFDSVSVREEESVDFIEKLTGVKCRRMCDPTILLDIKEYDDLVEDIKIDGEYVFFFWLLNDNKVYEGIEFVNRLSRMYHVPVLHSLYGEYCRYINNGLETMFYCSPGQFLNYIKNASVIVTNSYHATLFSLRYQKKVFVSMVESMRSRFDTLLELYGIHDCLMDDYLVKGIQEVNLDFRAIENQMKEERAMGIEYLTHSFLGGP